MTLTYTVENIKEMLHDVIIVTFVKKTTGEQRTIKCTTNLDKIETKFHPKGSTTRRRLNENVIRVFDLEKNSWRSFDVNTILSVGA